MNGEDEHSSKFGSMDPLRELMRVAEEELSGAGTSEYRKLFLAVSRIASHLESERGTLNRLIGRVDRQEKLLTGDNENPGLKGSVDMLNEEMKRRRKMNWLIASSVIALLVLKVGELFLKK